MDKKIQEWISEGKTDEEISALICSEDELQDDVKSLNEEGIAEAILKGRKAADVAASLAKKKADKQAADQKAADQKAIDDKVKTAVDDKLKSLNIDPTGSVAKAPRSLKWFDPVSREFKEHAEKPTEAYVKMNEMLGAIVDGDKARAKSISNEIDQHNARMEAIKAGKATPTVTDVDARGGYATPTEVDDMIHQLIYNQSVMLGLVNQDNLIYDSKIYPLMYGMEVVDIADQSTALTEKNPTFSNPTVSMKRAGAYSVISNEILRQKGGDIVNAFISAYTSEFAKFLDSRLAIGNVTGQSHLVDGVVFDANTSTPTAITLANLSLSTLEDMKNTLDASVDMSKTAFVGNRKVAGKIGQLENTGGQLLFPQYLNGGQISPFGIPLVTNSQMISTLDVGGDDWGGTDDVLILADFSKVIAGISRETRIEFSEHYQFINDALTIRGIKNYGQKVISGSSTAGVVAIAQELTN
jgi:HK97 family phage major capsid protein